MWVVWEVLLQWFSLLMVDMLGQQLTWEAKLTDCSCVLRKDLKIRWLRCVISQSVLTETWHRQQANVQDSWSYCCCDPASNEALVKLVVNMFWSFFSRVCARERRYAATVWMFKRVCKIKNSVKCLTWLCFLFLSHGYF